VEAYLNDNPQTVVALAYFDLDLYPPIKTCLELIFDRVPKGGVLGFDELNCKKFLGKTEAAHEVLGLENIKIKRRPYGSQPSYVVKT